MVYANINIYIVFLWVLRDLFLLSIWSYWWQQKEYRADRFFVFLKSLDGRKELYLTSTAFLLLVFNISAIYQKISLISLVYLLVLVFFYLSLFYKKKLRRPVFTKRVINISIITISSTSIFSVICWYFFKNLFITLLYSEIFIYIGLYFGILLTQLISERVKIKEKETAIKRLKNINPKTIAITGSYGKTTTKDFIETLIKQKYKVLKNPGSQNTEFGIIRAINSGISEKIKYLVLEVGAYKMGEIRKITDFVKPKTSVITGISNQHLELFGSQDKIINAKYEIVEALPKKGVAIFNLNDSHCKNLFQKAKRNKDLKVYGYLTGKVSKKPDNILRVTSIEKEKKSTYLIEINFENENIDFKVPIGIKKFIDNISCAILVAKLEGISWKDIQKGLNKISLPKATMNIKELKNGSIIIDDSFNSSYQGFKLAISQGLEIKNKKRVVFTTGIIELGNQSEAAHREIGTLLRDGFEKIILRNKHFEKPIRSGLGNQRHKLEVVTDTKLISKYFEKYINLPGYLIILEGKLPSSVINMKDKL